MSVPSDYRTGPVEIGANTYIKPANNIIGEALGSVINTFGKYERGQRLSETEQMLEAKRQEFFGTGTEAQQEIASAVEASIAKAAGQELSPKQREELAAIQQKGAKYAAALEQGVMKRHTFNREMERLLRTAKRDRPDLAPELDKLYADTLGWDVRGAEMDYYNYTLNKYQQLSEAEAAKSKTAKDIMEDKIKITDEMIKGLPEDLRPQVEADWRASRLAYANTGNVGMMDKTIVRLNSILGDTEARTKTSAIVESDKLMTEITQGSVKLVQAVQGNPNFLTPDGKLTDDVKQGLVTNITKIDAAIGKLSAVGGMDAEARIRILTTERERLNNVLQSNTQQAFIQAATDRATIAEMGIDTNTESRVLETLSLMNIPPAERPKEFKEMAPALQAGQSIAQSLFNGQRADAVKVPAAVTNKVSSQFVGKMISRMGSTDTPERAIDLSKPLFTSLLAYGAKRVDGQGRVVVRSQQELFGSGGALSMVGAESFTESTAAKRMRALPPVERKALAMALAMNLDRYSEAVAASANAADARIANRPTSMVKALYMIDEGKLTTNVGYSAMPKDAYKGVEGGESVIAGYNGYEENAKRAWKFILELSQ